MTRLYQTMKIRVAGNRKTQSNILDVVRGCVGARREPGGCYGACYACKMAKMAGVDFSTPVEMSLDRGVLNRSLERMKQDWVRIGVSGDPSWSWNLTLLVTGSCLYKKKTPVVITKGWKRATDEQLRSLAYHGTILHVSLSGLDGYNLVHCRLDLAARYIDAGGKVVIRLISAPLTGPKDGFFKEEMGPSAWLQDKIIEWARAYKVPILETPLRCFSNNRYLVSGVIDKSRMHAHVSPITGKPDGQLTGGRMLTGDLVGYCDTKCEDCINQCWTVPYDHRAGGTLPAEVLEKVINVW